MREWERQKTDEAEKNKGWGYERKKGGRKVKYDQKKTNTAEGKSLNHR